MSKHEYSRMKSCASCGKWCISGLCAECVKKLPEPTRAVWEYGRLSPERAAKIIAERWCSVKTIAGRR